MWKKEGGERVKRGDKGGDKKENFAVGTRGQRMGKKYGIHTVL